MGPSMRPVVWGALRNRLPLPLVTLAIVSLGRLASGASANWIGSDPQTALALVVFVALVPMLAIAMASGWLRGDALPWAWALARPVTRARWLGTTAVIDVVTLATCVVGASMVIEPLPTQWLGPLPGDGSRQLGYACALFMTYAAASFAGARGGSAIAGALHAAGLAAVIAVIDVVASIVGTTVAEVSLGDRLRLYRIVETAISFDGRGLLVPEVAQLATLMMVTAFVAIALLRTAARSPARPTHRSVLSLVWPALVLAGVIIPAVLVRIAATAI